MAERAGDDEAGTTEVGATGGDLLLWRAREAVRNAELRLSVQSQAMQSLEQRAMTIIGWCVAAVLVVGAVAVDRSRPHATLVAAMAAGMTLIVGAFASLVGMAGRLWSGPGLQPALLLADESASEFEALVGFGKAYQRAIEENRRRFHNFKHWLDAALLLLFLAPVLGLGLLALSPPGSPTHWGSALPESARLAVPGPSAHGSLHPPAAALPTQR